MSSPASDSFASSPLPAGVPTSTPGPVTAAIRRCSVLGRDPVFGDHVDLVEGPVFVRSARARRRSALPRSRSRRGRGSLQLVDAGDADLAPGPVGVASRSRSPGSQPCWLAQPSSSSISRGPRGSRPAIDLGAGACRSRSYSTPATNSIELRPLLAVPSSSTVRKTPKTSPSARLHPLDPRASSPVRSPGPSRPRTCRRRSRWCGRRSRRRGLRSWSGSW